jgi:hypothetical protein
MYKLHQCPFPYSTFGLGRPSVAPRSAPPQLSRLAATGRPQPLIPASARAAPSRAPIASAAAPTLCKQWSVTLACRRLDQGKRCDGLHPADHVPPPLPECRAFQQGDCRRSHCRYTHTPAASDASPAAPTSILARPATPSSILIEAHTMIDATPIAAIDASMVIDDDDAATPATPAPAAAAADASADATHLDTPTASPTRSKRARGARTPAGSPSASKKGSKKPHIAPTAVDALDADADADATSSAPSARISVSRNLFNALDDDASHAATPSTHRTPTSSLGSLASPTRLQAIQRSHSATQPTTAASAASVTVQHSGIPAASAAPRRAPSNAASTTSVVQKLLAAAQLQSHQ